LVEFTDLSQVTALYQELHQVDGVIENFDHGGQIIAMTVSAGDQPLPPGTIPGPMMRRDRAISTAGITYPPPMVDAIKLALNARRQQIMQQLKQLGVET
jgi:hypothetical protein